MGKKTQPSASSGGIGLTQEVGQIGGMSVTGGVSVDVSPIELDISATVDPSDPNKNSISIAGSAELPGGLIGLGGGVKINTNTGAIQGGSISGEIGGFGVEVSADSEEGLGITLSYQIPFTPVTISIGFGQGKKEEKPTTPTPHSRPGIGNKIEELPLTIFKDTCLYYVIYFQHGAAVKLTFDKPLLRTGSHHYYEQGTWTSTGEVVKKENLPISHYSPGFIEWHDYPTGSRAGYKINDTKGFAQLQGYGSYSPATIEGNVAISYSNGNAGYLYNYGAAIKDWIRYWVMPNSAWEFSVIEISCAGDPPTKPATRVTPINQAPLSPLFPPSPNPPPKKEMDECCRLAIRLLRQIKKFEQETMNLLGRPLSTKGDLIPLPGNAKFFGEEIERIKTPVEDILKPEKEKIKFGNFYELLMYALKQQIDLDVGIDPKSFKTPVGYVQNPNYERDSETSLVTNIQPDVDNFGNDREVELGDKIKINSLAGQQQYMFEAVRRMEYLFPYGELADAKFDKSLIIPGATGEIKIHNIIHFQEFLAQYLGLAE